MFGSLKNNYLLITFEVKKVIGIKSSSGGSIAALTL